MALDNRAMEAAPEVTDKLQEHNEMREELVAAGFESFGLAAEQGVLARNKDGKIVYLRDEGQGYRVFDWNESSSSAQSLPRNVAIQEATRKLTA